ncbi:MAG: NfeD family protein [Actinobacteria bacterium]|nr:MAG: NfeD family protein [Actinomycetota bacterium]
MPGWVIWAIVAVALAVGEIFTPGLFILGPVAVAAVAALAVAAFGVGPVLQLIVFIGGSLASLAFLRPIARTHLHLPAALRTGSAALVGTRATVLQRVDDSGGLVRIGGEDWTARPYMDGEVFEPGTKVEVAEIKGATALVYQ